MKTYNFIYQNNQFRKNIDFSLFEKEKHILIQVFCGQGSSTLDYITNFLEDNLPHAICIGTTTDGEIKDNKVSTLKSVVSISVFKKTFLKCSYKNDSNSFKNGYDIAKEIVTDNTKLILTFTDSINTNAEEYLEGINSYNKSIKVCGGMAGDNGLFEKTYISLGKDVFPYGAVAVSLNSDVLKVENEVKHGWVPIGIEHTIDKVEGNRIYEISGMKAINFYEKYLGSSSLRTFTEFPLIVQRKGVFIARAAVTIYPDGSLGCAGKLLKGDKVRLGIADPELIINTPFEYLKDIENQHAETFFIYSCMARRRYMQNLTKLEIEPFASLATTCGFFTYAEFFSDKDENQLMNQTFTIVSLSENPNKKFLSHPTNNMVSTQDSSYARTIQALTNLVQQSAKDQNEQSKALEEQIQYSNNLLKNQKVFLRYTVHETNTPLSVIMSNIELHEMHFGKSTYLENIDVAVKNIFSIYDDLSYLVKRDQIKDTIYSIDLVDIVRNRVDFFKAVALQVNSELLFNSNKNKIIMDFNETKLLRIVDNTLTNAIKYTIQNKPIRVDILKKDDYVRFSVTNHSRKIQQPKKIFDEYYREERSKDGFGLGLNLVKRICDEEDIKIEVCSTTELTCFSYYFKGSK